MEKNKGKVYDVINTYRQIKDERFEQELNDAYMYEIASGCCERLFEIYELTKGLSENDNTYNFLKNDLGRIEIQVIVDVYNVLVGKNEKGKKLIGKPKLTRGMIVVLCDYVKNNKKQLNNNDNKYVQGVDPFIFQHDKAEKNTEGGYSMLYDVHKQGFGENPYLIEIQQLKIMLAERDLKIKQLEAAKRNLETQFIDIERQFQNKEEKLKQEKITLESEYAQKNLEFDAYVTDKKAALEAELQERHKQEEIAFENNCRARELMVQNYYEDELQKAKQKIDAYIAQEKAEADSKAQKWFEEFLKDKVGDYLKEKEDAWKDGHQQFDDIRENITRIIGTAKLDGCNQASRIQRELVEQMNSVMSQFGANMDKWRDAMYSVQFEDFARWASKFLGFVDRFDKRVADNINDGEISPDIIRLGKTLVSLRNQLDRAMMGMGLRCFYPESGANFDPVYHEVDTDNEISMDAEIQECKNPGIEMGLADTSNTLVLSKAEVLIKE